MLLKGGPLDGARCDAPAEHGGLVEIAGDGLIHRYIPSSATDDGSDLPVYQFDGTVYPDGGQPGAENPQARLASPLADEMRADGVPPAGSFA